MHILRDIPAEALIEKVVLRRGGEVFTAAQTGLAESMGVKNAKVMWPVRIAAAGKAVTPGGAVEICRILGREETLRRLRIALEKLG